MKVQCQLYIGLESSTVVTAKKDLRIKFIDAATLTAEVEYNGMNVEIRMLGIRYTII